MHRRTRRRDGWAPARCTWARRGPGSRHLRLTLASGSAARGWSRHPAR
ncbi:hypothetical protein ACFPRL_08230 [Pseudoclavibacter helvolus]